MEVHCKYDELVEIKALKAHPKNRNQHPKDQLERLTKILKYQGWRHPIKVSKRSGFIVSGHGRLSAAKMAKEDRVPVVYQDYISEEQEYSDLQSDNAIASWSELALSKINVDLQDLGPDFDIDLLGIKDFVLEPADKYGDKDADEVPVVGSTDIKTGDLFSLGSHRLLCGDSTEALHVQRLMNGEKADIFLTDPPYGVSYTDKNEYLNSIGKPMACPNAIQGDHQTVEEMGELWVAAYKNAIENSKDRASFYIFSPQSGDLMMMMMIDKAGWTLKHMLVWVKNNHVLGRCDYHYKHEPIFYGWNKVHDFYGGSSCFSVLEFDKPLKNDLHPTMKPVALLEKLVTNSSQTNGKILDLFLGSGSTLIACEKTNRKCYGMEIDPQYCQVIIDRFKKFTDKPVYKIEQDGSQSEV